MSANDGTIYIDYYVSFRLDELSDRENAYEKYCCLKTQIEIKNISEVIFSSYKVTLDSIYQISNCANYATTKRLCMH